jgi:hypothetical protein
MAPLCRSGLERCSKFLGFPDVFFTGGGFQLGERGDAQILVEPERLHRTKPGYAEDLEHALRKFLSAIFAALISGGFANGSDFRHHADGRFEKPRRLAVSPVSLLTAGQARSLNFGFHSLNLILINIGTTHFAYED